MQPVNEYKDVAPDEQFQQIAEDVFVFPASFAQQRLWFLDKLEPGQGYNVPFAIRLTGQLRPDILERALGELVARHEVLRTTFSEDESGKAIQLVSTTHNFALTVTDLSSLPAATRETEARSLVIEQARSPFELKAGPLFRAMVFRLAEDDHVLSLAFHHSIVDGGSFGILLRELVTLYEAFEKGAASPLKPLPIQYGDYATWQHDTLQGERLEKLLAYWKKALHGAPPVLDLPTDFPRPPAQTFNGSHESVLVSRSVEQGLADLGKKQGATLFMTLLACFSVLLSRYSGQEDLVVASPISGRTRAELEGLIGFFVNTLPLRADLSGNPSFRTLLDRVRESALQAYAHQELPFEKLVEELNPERNLSHNPIVQVMFTFDSAPPRPQAQMGDIAIAPFRGAEGMTTKFDLSLNAVQNKDGLTVGFTYNVDLFAPETVKRMLLHFCTLLEGIVANPDCPVADLPLMEAAEQQVLLEWNATGTLSASTLLHQFVEQQTARTPDAVALIDGTKQVTYGELNSRANQLARKLQKLGVGPEVLVAVCTERCADMIVALLAVLKSGGAYVPLDPMYPKDRVAKILEDSHAKVMITQEPLIEILPPHSAEVIFIDRDWPAITSESDANPDVPVKAQNLAYVLFTSGSTGRPKGVALEHRSASIFVQWAQTVFTPEELAGTLFGTSICFDLSIFEMFVPLSVGGTVIIAQNALALRDLPAANEVRLINTVPSAIAELLRMNAVPSSVLTVNLAGEALPETLAREIYQQTSVRKLYNLYGPTEDTTYSTYALVPRTGEVTIGRPIANTQAYILDRHRQPVPIGVPGELYLAGDGLARGYYGRDDLTAERFVPNPFSQQPNARMYRTGDSCRYRADGTIEYLGRIDNQVKLRGFRIELGEIESVLAEHGAVRQSFAIVREDSPGNQQLVAYVLASRAAVDLPTQLRTHLSQRVPNYMVPSAIVVLESFPLTPNGKVDRRALPAPDFTDIGPVAEAGNEVEHLLVGIWKHLLGIETVGVTNNFFELGGHSLLATQMASRIRRAFQLELPLRLLFEHPTIAELAKDIERLRRAEHASVPKLTRQPRRFEKNAEGEEVAVFPVSFAEQRLWMLDRLQPNSSAYNLSIGLRLQGDLQINALERSIEEILRRHEVLRVSFRVNGDEPEQCIGRVAPVTIPVTNFSNNASPEGAAREFLRKESQRPFDLANGPLWRASLAQLADDDHVLLITVHHIAFDGWSAGVLLRELAAHYTACAGGPASRLPELEIQYPDFAVWQREYLSGERLEKQVNYWKGQLAGAPGHIELPTDHPRPRIQTFHGSQLSLTIPVELSAKLKQLAQKNEATLFMTLLAAFSVLLARYSGQDDVIVGSPIAGRTRTETENLIGFFVNTIPLRITIAANPTVRQLLASVRETTLDAYAHQDLPFEKLVEEIKPERDLSRNPIFQVMFALQNVPRETTELPGLKLSPFRAGSAVNSKFDLSLIAVENGDSINAVFEYNTDLFQAQSIELMQRHWLMLLESIAANPDRPIGDVDLLTEAEREQQIVAFNATDQDYPRDLCVHQLFERQVEKTPEAIAVADGSRSLTYSALNRRANQLARYLQKQGVQPQTLVGICLDRSVDMLVAVLGVLKAGAAYVPLDPAYPKDRIAFVMEDSQASVLITQTSLLDTLPSTSARLVRMDADWNPISSENDTTLQSLTTSNGPAYVIYTSGSTGKPKGVEIGHRSVVNFLTSMQREPGFKAEDTLLAVTTLSFDIAGLELYLPLSAGGKVVIASREDAGDGALLMRRLKESQATVMQATPASWRLLLESGWKGDTQLKILCGGEALPRELAEKLLPRCGELWNMYGPTETTIWSSVYRVRDCNWTSAPIGRPIANTQMYVLDKNGHLVPLGVPGELHIGGDGLAYGYWKRPEMTAHKFVSDPFSRKPGTRMYKTGDLVRYLPDGNLQYLSRIDNQVKLRGFRIELGEIESVLAEHEAVRQSFAIVREDSPGNQQLVAYVLASPAAVDLPSQLRAHLSQRVPNYMVPSAIVVLESFPLTPNGKIDRRALPAPDGNSQTATEFVAPRTQTEQALAAIWAEVLRRPAVGIHDDFFALGGHSLLATQVISRIQVRLQRELPLRTLFERPTVEQLAKAVEETVAGDAPKGKIAPANRAAFRAKRT